MRVKSNITQEAESDVFALAIESLKVVVITAVTWVFLFQPFNIPSGSMLPTLHVGDYLFVSKYSYGYSKFSFPFGLKLFDGRVLFSEPSRGDVVVFKTPADNSRNFIKRLVGLPGDRIQMIEGVLNINGVPVDRERVEDLAINEFDCPAPVRQYRETLSNGRSYVTQKLSETCGWKYKVRDKIGGDCNRDNTKAFVVPPGYYFMMGDNRDNSADSRFDPNLCRDSNGVGLVPAENLIGRARILFFSIGDTASWFAPWRWPLEIRWSGIGNVIH
jgi:signal peptidase I